MDSWPVNPADLIVLAIVAVSGLLAFARGLVREVLSIIGWVGAAIITLYGIPYLRPYVAMMVTLDPLLVDVASGVLIFVVTLVVLSLASYGVARQMRDSQLTALDRTLGFVFGVARGAILVSLAYMVVSWALPADEHPRALREARTLPLIQMGVQLLTGMVPDSWKGATAKQTEDQRRQQEDEARRNAKKAMETLVSPQVKPAATRATQGYNEKERQDMDRLFQGAKGAQQ